MLDAKGSSVRRAPLIMQMVVRSPFLLGLSYQTLTTRIAALQAAFPDADVQRMVEYYPSLLEVSAISCTMCFECVKCMVLLVCRRAYASSIRKLAMAVLSISMLACTLCFKPLCLCSAR